MDEDGHQTAAWVVGRRTSRPDTTATRTEKHGPTIGIKPKIDDCGCRLETVLQVIGTLGGDAKRTIPNDYQMWTWCRGQESGRLASVVQAG
jgi:hypothetical protein